MDVSDDLHGRRELDEGWLTEEDFPRSLTYGDNLYVLDAEGLADLAGVADVEQALDHVVNIKRLELLLGGTKAGRAE